MCKNISFYDSCMGSYIIFLSFKIKKYRYVLFF